MTFIARRGGVLPVEPRAALVLAPETPYPLAGGGALRTASLLHYLRTRYEVDLLVFREPGAADPRAGMPAGLVRRLVVLDLLPIAATLSRAPSATCRARLAARRR